MRSRAKSKKIALKFLAFDLFKEIEIIRLSLEQDFEQRQNVLQQLFQNLDYAIKNTHVSPEVVHALLQTILAVTKTSSLQELSQFFSQPSSLPTPLRFDF